MPRALGSLTLLCLLLAWGPVSAQPALPLIEDVQAAPLRDDCVPVLRFLQGKLPAQAERKLTALLRKGASDADNFAEEVQRLLDPLCLVGVTINPESRVKAARGDLPAELARDRETYVLVKVHNDAGVTHGLIVSGPQLRGEEGGGKSQWLEATVMTAAPLRKSLSGHRLEYVVLRLKATESGKREATLKFDVGQGTQDLGFRAEVPVLFTVKAP